MICRLFVAGFYIIIYLKVYQHYISTHAILNPLHLNLETGCIHALCPCLYALCAPDKESGERLSRLVEEACMLLADYSGRLAAEIDDRRQLTRTLTLFLHSQKDGLAQNEQKLEVRKNITYFPSSFTQCLFSVHDVLLYLFVIIHSWCHSVCLRSCLLTLIVCPPVGIKFLYLCFKIIFQSEGLIPN